MADAAPWMAPGRSSVAGFIVVPDAMRVAEFAERVFGATRLSAPLWHADGRPWNLDISIGDSTVMLGDADPEGAMTTPGFLYLQVPDARAAYEAALAAGARAIMPPEPRFHSAVDGGVEDMAGNLWWIATHAEDLTDAEIAGRARGERKKRAQKEQGPT